MQNVLILNDDILTVLKSALLNHKAGEANPVMQEIDAQLRLADQQPEKFLKLLDEHTKRFHESVDVKKRLSELETLKAAQAARDARRKKRVA